MRKAILSLVVGSTLIFGWGGAQEANENADSVRRTVVRFDEDGQPIVTTSRITVAEQRAEIEARRRMIEQGESGDKLRGALMAGMEVDPGCAAASLWVFDNTHLSGNEVCFYGAGQAWLSHYARPVCYRRHRGWDCFEGTWREAVRSYWAGVSGGRFSRLGSEWFQPWQRVDYAGYTAQQAGYVDFSF